jgi:hypothetical protein
MTLNTLESRPPKDPGMDDPAATPAAPTDSPLELGPGANWRQFWLLVLVNAFVGAMVGLPEGVPSCPSSVV